MKISQDEDDGGQEFDIKATMEHISFFKHTQKYFNSIVLFV